MNTLVQMRAWLLSRGQLGLCRAVRRCLIGDCLCSALAARHRDPQGSHGHGKRVLLSAVGTSGHLSFLNYISHIIYLKQGCFMLSGNNSQKGPISNQGTCRLPTSVPSYLPSPTGIKYTPRWHRQSREQGTQTCHLFWRLLSPVCEAMPVPLSDPAAVGWEGRLSLWPERSSCCTGARYHT